MLRLFKNRDVIESIFLLLGLGFVIALVVLIVLFGLAIFTSHSDDKIAGDITISSQWVTITSNKPLKHKKDYQDLVLEVAAPLKEDNLNSEHMELKDGTIFHPEAQIVDQFGNAYNLKLARAPTPSYHSNSVAASTFELPADRSYTQVRLRSDQPLHLSRVLWHCVNGK
jgi:hypothetical protein